MGKASPELDPIEEVVRLLVLQLRRSSASQGELAAELSRAGFGPARIAKLLGTSTQTVSKDLQRAKKPRGARPSGRSS